MPALDSTALSVVALTTVGTESNVEEPYIDTEPKQGGGRGEGAK